MYGRSFYHPMVVFTVDVWGKLYVAIWEDVGGERVGIDPTADVA
jgi:hypothetical protein